MMTEYLITTTALLFFYPFHFLPICMLQQGTIFEKAHINIYGIPLFLLWILHFHIRPYAFARFFDDSNESELSHLFS